MSQFFANVRSKNIEQFHYIFCQRTSYDAIFIEDQCSQFDFMAFLGQLIGPQIDHACLLFKWLTRDLLRYRIVLEMKFRISIRKIRNCFYRTIKGHCLSEKLLIAISFHLCPRFFCRGWQRQIYPRKSQAYARHKFSRGDSSSRIDAKLSNGVT